VFRDAADEYVNVRAGEVIIKVESMPHSLFTREKETLKMSMDLTLREALLGFEKEITHLDGHKVTISKINKTTQQGETMRISEEGMPKYGSPSEYGDLIVTFNVKNPVSLDDGQRTLLKKFFTG